MLFIHAVKKIIISHFGKWETILHLYHDLLKIEYLPIATLNGTFLLSKANGKLEAII
jgi:predicted RNA polymerase sigma factor